METKKILYADDDPEIREALRLLLGCEGYETLEATNGEEVLRLLDDTVDLVILDVMMPGMNGMQGMGQSGAGGGFAQSQRMKNPVSMEATHAPENNREAYMASLRSLLSRNVGYFIVCTFLVGTQQSVTWQGILHTVGSDYLVLYQPENERYVSCDLYALKFAQFHNVKSTPYCAGSRVWEGRSEP